MSQLAPTGQRLSLTLVLAYITSTAHSALSELIIYHILRADTTVVQVGRVIQQRRARIKTLAFFPVQTIRSTSTRNSQSFLIVILFLYSFYWAVVEQLITLLPFIAYRGRVGFTRVKSRSVCKPIGAPVAPI
jgi:hypothetical protein